MLTFVLTGFFVTALIVSLVSFADSAMKWRNAYRRMRAEMALERPAALPAHDRAVVILQPARLTRPAPTIRAGAPIRQQASLAVAA